MIYIKSYKIAKNDECEYFQDSRPQDIEVNHPQQPESGNRTQSNGTVHHISNGDNLEVSGL